jgi:hypothetical protein
MDVPVLVVLLGTALVALVAAARRETPEPVPIPVRVDDDRAPR